MKLGVGKAEPSTPREKAVPPPAPPRPPGEDGGRVPRAEQSWGHRSAFQGHWRSCSQPSPTVQPPFSMGRGHPPRTVSLPPCSAHCLCLLSQSSSRELPLITQEPAVFTSLLHAWKLVSLANCISYQSRPSSSPKTHTVAAQPFGPGRQHRAHVPAKAKDLVFGKHCP